jgi:protein-tyrosine phosphatase
MTPMDGNSVIDLLRPPIRALRSFRDRARHPILRRRAEKVVRGVSRPQTIVFLCTGNICRSPYAEKVFERSQRAGLAPKVTVLSAGFLAPGRPSPEEAVRIARDRGISLEAHRSRQASPESLAACDLLVCMEPAHLAAIAQMLGPRHAANVVLLGDLDSETPERREIVDPWGRGDRFFVAAFERIERCAARLGALLHGEHTTNSQE